MAHVLFQWAFKDPQVKALTDNPQDRTSAARRLVEGAGGTLHSHFFCFGEFDGITVAEFPDEVSAAACAFTAIATGGFTRFETRPLLTPQDAQRAMEKAGKARSEYRPPSG